jgi:hypothetical protein
MTGCNACRPQIIHNLHCGSTWHSGSQHSPADYLLIEIFWFESDPRLRTQYHDRQHGKNRRSRNNGWADPDGSLRTAWYRFGRFLSGLLGIDRLHGFAVAHLGRSSASIAGTVSRQAEE